MDPAPQPYFSIVIPVYNRASLVVRAVQSCLTQTFRNHEVIVVDDGSSDGSADAVRRLGDPRVTVLVHPSNRGVCPARNTGLAAASGEWLICLDSDDELLPEALARMSEATHDVSGKISSVRFQCVMDDGTISPDPAPPEGICDYRSYLAWAEISHGGNPESLICVRRDTFPSVRYPDNAGSELLYHLDFARRYLTENRNVVVRAYHQDAAERITGPSRLERSLYAASGRASCANAILRNHGAELVRRAPGLYAKVIESYMTESFLTGARRTGLAIAAMYLRFRKGRPSLKLFGVVIPGLLGPRPLAFARAMMSQFRP